MLLLAWATRGVAWQGFDFHRVRSCRGAASRHEASASCSTDFAGSSGPRAPAVLVGAQLSTLAPARCRSLLEPTARALRSAGRGVTAVCKNRTTLELGARSRLAFLGTSPVLCARPRQ